MLECQNINKKYQTKYEKIEALTNINLEFTQNELVFILGKSGSGKTTLLNLLGGMEKPTNGKIKWNKKEISNLDNYRKYKIGFITQDFKLIENFTVIENIILSLELKNKKDQKLIYDILDKLELTPIKDKKVLNISGGEKQRVAIARALVKNPYIILADEPTSALDSKTSKIIFYLLKEMSKDKLIIVVSHDQKAAEQYADKIITLKNGTISNIKIKNNNHHQANLEKEIISKTSFSTLLKYSVKNLLSQKKVFVLAMILITMLTTCFGFTLVLNNFDVNKSHAEALIDSKENGITLLKAEGNTPFNKLFTEEEIAKIIEDLQGYDFLPIYNIYANNEFYTFNFVNTSNVNDFYQFYDWKEECDYLYIPLTEKFNYDYIGNLPNSEKEIMISNFLAYYIVHLGAYNENNEIYYPKNFEDLLNNNKIRINNSIYEITGIYLLEDNISSKTFLNIEEEEYLLKHLYHIYVNPSFFKQQFPLNNVNYTYLEINLNEIPILPESSKNLQQNEIIISYDLLNKLTNNRLYEIYSKEDLTEKKALEYIIQNNMNSQKLNLYIKDLFHLFKDTKQEMKIMGVGEETLVSSQILNQYIFKADLVRYIIFSPKELQKTLKILDNNYPENIKYHTKYSDDFQNITKITQNISNLVKNMSYTLLLILTIIVLFYFHLHFKLNESFFRITRYLGMSIKEERKIYLLENSLFSFLIIGLSILLLNIIIIVGNFILSNKMGYEISLLKNGLQINIVVGIVIIFYLILSSIINIHKLKKL